MTVETVTPLPSSSARAIADSRSNPILEATYAPVPGASASVVPELTLTMLPALRARIPGRTASLQGGRGPRERP